MNNVIIITGGTGGHITPAIALAEELIKRNYNIIFLTDGRFKQFNFQLPAELLCYSIDSTSPFKKGLKSKMLFLYKSIIGFVKTLKIIKKHDPKILVSFGGYMSFPGLLASIFLKKRYIIHEQNAILGKANKFFANRAYLIATSFKKIYNLKQHLNSKVVYVGNLVRKEFINIRNTQKGEIINFEEEGLKILVIGGSQGAKVFDEIIPRACSFINRDQRKKISITQQVKQDNVSILQGKYKELGIKAELAEFFPNIYDYYKKSNLIITRAGASTLAEIATIGKAAILIPYPYAAENHQFLNAKSLVYEGAAWCVEENDEIVKNVSEILNKILENYEILKLKTESAGKNFINAQIKLADIIDSV